MKSQDIFIIGGGINGAAIAADAAGRGLSVTLCEKGDIASATSSASTKLIHGGLRYLELYEFNLVRKALREREILMRKAPHLVAPLKFILPHEKHLRPVWLMRLGLFLYDHLAKKKYLPNSHYLKKLPGTALKDQFRKGFSYYDCHTDDSRLTITNMLSAQESGAAIFPRCEFINAEWDGLRWYVQFKNVLTDKMHECFATVLVNASGPWIDHVQKIIDPQKTIPCQLVKGSHIVVPRLFTEDFAYILQYIDGRIVFAIPFQQQFTLIGTTDSSFADDLNQVAITLDEKNYLCHVINQYFKKSITPEDILWSYAGVRCLQDEHSANLSKISRDYKLQWDDKNLLTVIGGKITTHRSLAQEAVDNMQRFFPALKPAWTEFAPLPGGDMPEHDFAKFYARMREKFSWLPEQLCFRYAKNYGTRMELLLRDAKNIADLGEKFSEDLYARELEYLVQHEWAMTVDDVLWRRTKLGLIVDEQVKAKIQQFFAMCHPA